MLVVGRKAPPMSVRVGLFSYDTRTLSHSVISEIASESSLGLKNIYITWKNCSGDDDKAKSTFGLNCRVLWILTNDRKITNNIIIIKQHLKIWEYY